MKLLKSAITCILISTGINTLAEEKYNHFPSLQAPDLKTALCNLQSYNQRLGAIVKKDELSAEDMVKVHELTYTLENAIIQMQKDLETIAVDLEKVHKASEALDQNVIKDSGMSYMKQTKMITDQVKCR